MQKQIDEISDSVKRIEDALIGNNLGNEGIVNRLKNVEKKAACNKKSISNTKSSSMLYGTGAGGVIIAVFESIKAYFTHG